LKAKLNAHQNQAGGGKNKVKMFFAFVIIIRTKNCPVIRVTTGQQRRNRKTFLTFILSQT
jgi:hypothetical protein